LEEKKSKKFFIFLFHVSVVMSANARLKARVDKLSAIISAYKETTWRDVIIAGPLSFLVAILAVSSFVVLMYVVSIPQYGSTQSFEGRPPYISIFSYAHNASLPLDSLSAPRGKVKRPYLLNYTSPSRQIWRPITQSAQDFEVKIDAFMKNKKLNRKGWLWNKL
jgi:hypothetical protein